LWDLPYLVDLKRYDERTLVLTQIAKSVKKARKTMLFWKAPREGSPRLSGAVALLLSIA
jgi:hypothetical protein